MISAAEPRDRKKSAGKRWAKPLFTTNDANIKEGKISRFVVRRRALLRSLSPPPKPGEGKKKSAFLVLYGSKPPLADSYGRASGDIAPRREPKIRIRRFRVDAD